MDVIDTWPMTITRRPGAYTGRFEIPLPCIEFVAVRLVASDPE